MPQPHRIPRRSHVDMALRQVKPLLQAAHLRPKDRVKLAVGAVVQPTQTRRWLDYVSAEPLLSQAAQQLPFVFSKIHRSYLNRRLNCRQRVDALIGHYQQVHQLGLAPLVEQALRAPQTLHIGATKSGQPFEVQWTAMREGHQEGELCLRLALGGQALFFLNFVFFSRAGQPCLLVSRLQGAASPQAREQIRQATRELHGLRPANLLIMAARQCAQILGCETVLLISNRERIATNWWRRMKITADYDQTWREMDALPCADGLFEISPQSLYVVDYSTIASKKRSEVKKKAALIDAMYAGLHASLARR